MSNKAPAAPRGEQVLSRQHSILPAGGREITALKIEHFDAMEEPVYGELTIRNKKALALYSPLKIWEIKRDLEFAATVERIGKISNTRIPDTLNGEVPIRHDRQLAQLSKQVWKLTHEE